VYDTVRALCTKMEMKFIPDIYVLESSGAINAFASRFFGRNMVVLYSAVFELIEEGAENELSFVIAHELAHIKRRHISKQLLVLPAMWIPGITQTYSRACEYTCDRMAAFYTGNSEAAKNALTIFSVGKILFKQVNRTSFLNQVNEEKGFSIWLTELLSTHPPLPKRINEIGLFMGDSEGPPIEKGSSKKLWLTLSVVMLLLIGIISGGIYSFKQLDIAAYLNKMGTSVNQETKSPLIDAVVAGDAQKVNHLLQTGIDVNTQDLEGWTALHWSTKASDVQITKVLLKAGAAADTEDYHGVTPLMTAASNGDLQIVQLLLDAETKIDHQDYDGSTPLMYAVSNGQAEIVKTLLKAGANTAIKDNQDLTALKLSIQQGYQDITALIRTYN
jgi:hypothetical protein